VTEYAAKHESRFVKLLVQQNEIGGKRKTAAAIKQLEQAQERIVPFLHNIKPGNSADRILPEMCLALFLNSEGYFRLRGAFTVLLRGVFTVLRRRYSWNSQSMSVCIFVLRFVPLYSSEQSQSRK